ncbi:MAG: NAD(P)-dependent oxidoreductase [bacterium]
MASIMVTGSSGFIGSYVVRELVKKGCEVVAFDVRPPIQEQAWLLRKELPDVKFCRGTIEDLSAVIRVVKENRIQMIVHAASIVDPPYLLQNPMMAYRINFGGTLNVLEAARIEGLERIIYLSTNGIFTSKKYEPIDENHPVISASEGPGNGPYSASKLASEAFGLSYASAFGFKFIALRPSAVYGFGMQYPMYIKPMVENSLKNLSTRIETGLNFPRDYTHVLDVTQAVIKALFREPPKDSIFLVATGKELVTPAMLLPLIKEQIPNCNIEIGEEMNGWNEKELKYRAMINIGRAKEQLGYDPLYDIKAGLTEYISMFKNYLNR